MLAQSKESARPVAPEAHSATAPAGSNQSRVGFERRANIRRIIESLRVAPMMRFEVRELLAMSPSGARKYIRELLGAGVIEYSRFVGGRPGYLGEPEFVLSEDVDRVVDFLSVLDAAPTRTWLNSKDKHHMDASHRTTGAGRRFHILADDEHYPVRVSKEPPAPDPLALPAPFFSPPRQVLRAKDRLPAASPAPPQPTGFNALVVEFARRMPDPVDVAAKQATKIAQQNERLRQDLIAECRASAAFFGRLAAGPNLQTPADRRIALSAGAHA